MTRAGSPYLNRPLRSLEQAQHDRMIGNMIWNQSNRDRTIARLQREAAERIKQEKQNGNGR